MSDFEIPKISKALNSDNYLLNCYNNLIKIKGIHFLFILIEILLNIIYEIEIMTKDTQYEYTSYLSNKNFRLNFVSSIANIFRYIPELTTFFILFMFVLVLDSLAYYVAIKKFKEKHIRLKILVSLLDIFFWRTIMLIFLNLFFTLNGFYFLISCIFVIPHLYYIMRHFIYNHLYYFVPEFIDYPYDEFSSSFDIILFIYKIILSITGTSNNSSLGQFCFYLLLFIQTFFSIYFINILINHSYLLMKNSFLNRARLSLFFTQNFITLIAILFGKDEIMTILFIIICIFILFSNIGYMHFIYNPNLYIKVKRETPMSNLFFYFFILSEKNDYNFLFEKKIKEHFEECGICSLCTKFNDYLKRYKRYKYKLNTENEEKEKLINEENNNKNNINDKLIDLFDIIYNNQSKYFELIKKIVINNKLNGKESLNNSYFYINLSFLIYSDYQKKNITLSLNERIILEEINKENRLLLDNHSAQINQLLLCNNFIELSNTLLSQLKDILNSEQNFYKAKKLIDLSYLLKKMKNKKYKQNLFSNKLENISNSKHLILICSIVYEEVFNTTLNNSQIPIRENFQSYDDIFNFNKINKIISLAIDLTNKRSKIIRAGKDLYTYINNDLFDLFPLIFKQHQINLFMSSILQNFDIKENDEIANNNTIIKNDKKVTRLGTKKSVKGLLKNTNNNKNKNKNENIEINLIICENNFSKMYYKLLTLKLAPLFNNDNQNFILFDGLYILNKNTIITLKDFEKNLNSKEILIAVSEPYLEEPIEVYSIPFKKYIALQKSKGYISLKMASFNLHLKLYNIYVLNRKEKESEIKKKERKNGQLKEGMVEDDEEQDLSFNKKSKVEKMQLIEDNASVSSAQTGSSYSNGISSVGVRNKKKENIYEYGGFNRIRKINTFAILTSLIILIVEYFYLKSLAKSTSNNNDSLLQYRELTRLYFQLFSSVLGVTCIFSNVYLNTEEECLRLIDIFTDNYFQGNKNKYFNYTLYSIIQNEYLSKELIEKKKNLANIHKNIGNKKYNELFGKEIDYFRVSQTIIDNLSFYIPTKIPMKFSEAVLLLFSSFQTLTENPDIIIILLDKFKDPFSLSNSIPNRGEFILSEAHKALYEMIINYKNYYREFEEINDKLIKLIISKSNFIEIFIYFTITFNTSMLIIVGSLMLIYTISFELILIKIINYINMTMNAKNDSFNFYETYLKKIENLEAILQFYKTSATKTVQKLNDIYNKYQHYLTSKKKSNANDMNKKNYKKIADNNNKNELDDIPKNQRIITRKDVKSLGITFIFIFMYFLNLFFVLTLYGLLLFTWIRYFTKKKKLYNLMNKNMSLEISVYRAINSFDLMIFDNLTISEITEVIWQNKQNENNELLKSFYDDLKIAFNSNIEKNYVGNLYSDFEDKYNFTCDILFNINNLLLQKIQNDAKASTLNNVTYNLINLCESTRIADTKDYRTVFERHFQYIRNGMLSLNDFTYIGRLLYIINDGTLARMSILFNVIIINIIDLIYTIPHKEAVSLLIKRMKNLIMISELIYLSYDIISILFVAFLYIPGINNLCNQVYILRKIFKIFEFQE